LSATNRGSKRVESDFYPTPIPVIHNFLDNHKLKDGIILEPSAGNGNFLQAIRIKGYQNDLVANELRKEEHQNLLDSGANIIRHNDFLDGIEGIDGLNISTIITNPPFTYAKEFIETCRKKYPKAELIMLLRLALLESKKRYEFWQQYPVNKLYILSQRPSFTGKGTDATAYAWFVWDGTGEQEIKVI
jgi:hypothetical protein